MEFIKEFKNKRPWTERLGHTQKLRHENPNSVPILIDRANNYSPKPSKFKFLVNQDFTLTQFLVILRKYLPDLEPHQALFLYVGDDHTLAPMSRPLSEIYLEFHDIDNFLTILYSTETSFG